MSGGIPHDRVLSVAISPSDRSGGRSVVYAGTEPSNVYRSEDDGRTWRPSTALRELPSATSWSFPPRPWTSHVRWIALSPTDPGLVFAGIELGGVMRSGDGGETWEDHNPGACLGAHALATHRREGARVYQAAGDGVAMSADAGDSWRRADEGMDRHYAWGLAVDPADPDLWYVSASHGPRVAHRDERSAEAILYRRRGDGPWEALDGGLPSPLPHMPYALVAPRERPGSVIAGLRSGELLASDDAGDSWRPLPVRLPKVLALAEAA